MLKSASCQLSRDFLISYQYVIDSHLAERFSVLGLKEREKEKNNEELCHPRRNWA